MSISLNAEQKVITKILSGKDQYIIPPYQRAYSWEQEQCEALWEDLKFAYLNNKEDGYFLGNIVIAKSTQDKNRLEVIDGQQRLISLTLLIKVLLHFNHDSNYLTQAIYIQGKKSHDSSDLRLKTNVYEEKDSTYLSEVMNSDITELCKNNSINNNFKKNICYFYEQIKIFSESNDVEDFSDFLLDNVSLLPIESEDIDQENAREKALKIFETINDRGKDLSNSDIFKANLYSMALNDLKQNNFIDRWKQLDSDCDNVGFDIERIFKIYSYQIRGLHGIKTPEIGLRDFFKKTRYSPFKTKSYNAIMDDLFNIVQAIDFFDKTQKHQNEELSKWFQLIDLYSNNFPKDLIFVFLAKNLAQYDEIKFIKFTKNLVRYCYFQGATSNIKQYIFDLTIKTMHDELEEYYPEDPKSKSYDYFGKLYKGFGLLSLYANNEQKSIYPYYLIRMRDLVSFWNDDYYSFDCVGNLLATDLSKAELLNDNINSKIHELDSMKRSFKQWDKNMHECRQDKIKKSLIEFFTKPENAN